MRGGSLWFIAAAVIAVLGAGWGYGWR